MLTVNDLDIFVVFPTLLKKIIGKVRRALIIEWIENHNCI